MPKCYFPHLPDELLLQIADEICCTTLNRALAEQSALLNLCKTCRRFYNIYNEILMEHPVIYNIVPLSHLVRSIIESPSLRPKIRFLDMQIDGLATTEYPPLGEIVLLCESFMIDHINGQTNDYPKLDAEEFAAKYSLPRSLRSSYKVPQMLALLSVMITLLPHLRGLYYRNHINAEAWFDGYYVTPDGSSLCLGYIDALIDCRFDSGFTSFEFETINPGCHNLVPYVFPNKHYQYETMVDFSMFDRLEHVIIPANDLYTAMLPQGLKWLVIKDCNSLEMSQTEEVLLELLLLKSNQANSFPRLTYVELRFFSSNQNLQVNRKLVDKWSSTGVTFCYVEPPEN